MFHEYLLRYREERVLLILKGPISSEAPYAIDEQPGPVLTYTNLYLAVILFINNKLKEDNPLLCEFNVYACTPVYHIDHSSVVIIYYETKDNLDPHSLMI